LVYTSKVEVEVDVESENGVDLDAEHKRYDQATVKSVLSILGTHVNICTFYMCCRNLNINVCFCTKKLKNLD